MNKSLIIISLFVLFISGIINAQSQILTLDDAIQLALQNNKDIKVSYLNTEKSAAAVREAFGYALPTVDVAADFSHFLKKPKMPFPDFEALFTNATYNILFEENIIPEDESKYQPIETQLQSFALNNTYSASLTLTQVLFSSAVFEGIGASQTYYELAKQNLITLFQKLFCLFRLHFMECCLQKRFLI